MRGLDLNSTVILLILGAHASGSNSDSIFKFHCDSINMFGKQADFAEKWHLNSTVILLIFVLFFLYGVVSVLFKFHCDSINIRAVTAL